MDEPNESELDRVRSLVEKLKHVFAQQMETNAEAMAEVVQELSDAGFDVLFEVGLSVVKREVISPQQPSAVEPGPVPQVQRKRLVRKGRVIPTAFASTDDDFLRALHIAGVTEGDRGPRS